MAAQEIAVWGEGTTGLWSYGESVDIPKGWTEVATGDPYVTRQLKSRARKLYVRMQKGRHFSSPVGIIAPKKLVEDVLRLKEETEARRVAARAKSSESRARREDKRRARLVDQLVKRYPGCPPDEAQEIIEHATEVGSGRVGRSSRADDPIRAAVIAHIRHYYTDYDELLLSGEDRFWAREDVLSENP